MPRPPVIPFPIEDVHLRRRASACRNHLAGRDFGEGSVNDLGDEMPDHEPRCHGCGEFAVHDSTLRGFQLDGSCAAIIVRDIRAEHAFDRHKDIGISEVIDHVASPIDLRGRPVEVHQ